MRDNPAFSVNPAKRLAVRIRPGGVIVIPRPILAALGGNAAGISVEVKANRLSLEKRKSPAEVRLARFKARLADRLHKPSLVGRRRALGELAAQAQELDSHPDSGE
jgi:hypothetical protein